MKQAVQINHRRLEWLDSYKGMLILLVIFGHLLEPAIRKHGLAEELHAFIYLFHMPAFVFACGYVAKLYSDVRKFLAGLLNLVEPLVIGHLLFLAIEIFFLDEAPELMEMLFVPRWVLWFLLSLICWRLMLQLFARLPFALPVSIAMALLIGVPDYWGYWGSYSRTVAFFPFFLAGYQIAQTTMGTKNEALKPKVAPVVFLALAYVAMVLIAKFTNVEKVLYLSYAYHDLGLNDWFGLL